ncbi:MAG TPA: SGNH/GDSL hydrolase family protein [Chthoniobacterales bacterium]|jgi:phospholipase/lecithinase/hemolysin
MMRNRFYFHRSSTAFAAALLGLFVVAAGMAPAQTPTFTQIVVFGDSLSDDGNIAHRARDTVGFSYPSSNPPFNYSDYRFTDDTNTNPAAILYTGVWHEQLAKSFLHLHVATNSLDGGLNATDYAFGGATTKDGTQERTIVNNPFPFGGGNFTITIDNMGKQVADYLASHTADPNALYILWGGGNDLFDDQSAANVTNTANRVGVLIQRLASAGARNFLVPNVPPLGAVPNSFGDPNRVASLDADSASYRDQLNSVIASTVSALSTGGTTIQVYTFDVWLDLIRVLAEPSKYGFVNVIDPAQGNSSVNPDQYLFWDDIHPTTAGHHQLASEANRLLSGGIPPLGKAANISTRGTAGTGEDVLIGGFIVIGTEGKKVLVRGIGPSLSNFGISGALADPTVTIFDSNHNVVATNDNWKSSQQAAIQATGLAPQNDLESAILITLPPGSYTAIVSGNNGGTGLALAEVYDLEPGSNSTLYNVSTRGFVGTGDAVLIGGVIIGQGEPPVLVLRAIGPSLASAGVSNPLQDPVIQLFDAQGMLITQNDNWHDSTPTAIKATLLAPTDDREAVIVASLAPGNYTAVVSGKNGTTGVALVEAFRLQ